MVKCEKCGNRIKFRETRYQFQTTFEPTKTLCLACYKNLTEEMIKADDFLKNYGDLYVEKLKKTLMKYNIPPVFQTVDHDWQRDLTLSSLEKDFHDKMKLVIEELKNDGFVHIVSLYDFQDSYYRCRIIITAKKDIKNLRHVCMFWPPVQSLSKEESEKLEKFRKEQYK